MGSTTAIRVLILMAAINLAVDCINYFQGKPEKLSVCPNRLIERPVTHPVHSPTPTLVVPGKS